MKALMADASSSSQRARGTPLCNRLATAAAAASRVGKSHVAALTAAGSGYSFSCASVMMASVPSLPTSSRVRSYPAEDLRARPPVRTTAPDART